MTATHTLISAGEYVLCSLTIHFAFSLSLPCFEGRFPISSKARDTREHIASHARVIDLLKYIPKYMQLERRKLAENGERMKRPERSTSTLIRLYFHRDTYPALSIQKSKQR